jgi:hypothetical protein
MKHSIGGVAAFIAALSLILIRGRDLQLESDEESASGRRPDEDAPIAQPVLAA